MGYGIYCNNSIISDNYVYVYDNTDAWGNSISFGIINHGNSSTTLSLTENNTVIAHGETRGFEGNYAIVRNNTFKGVDEETGTTVNHEWAIMGGNYNEITGNTMIGFYDGIHVDDDWNVIIENNYIQSRHWGVYANNGHGEHIIRNNEFIKYTTDGEWFVYATNMDNIFIEDNTFVGDGGNLLVTPGRGIQIENQAGSEINQNTIIGSNGDYGIHMSNLSAPSVYSNIIQGFQVGIHADNDLDNYELRNNDL